MAVRRALVQDHADELEIVADGGIEAAAAHLELGVLLDGELHRHPGAVLTPHMHGRHPLLHGRRDPEGGVAHAERVEDVLLHVLPEPLPAHRLDHLAGPVDADAVVPALARIEQERRRQRGVLAARDLRNALRLLVGKDVRVPDFVHVAGGMGQQVAQRHRALRRARLRLALLIEAFQHLDFAQIRDDRTCRSVQFQLALLDHLHGRRAGDGLGHGGDPADRVGRHGDAAAGRAFAEPALVDGPFRRRRRRHDAGNVPARNRRLQDSVHTVLERHGSLPPNRPVFDGWWAH